MRGEEVVRRVDCDYVVLDRSGADLVMRTQPKAFEELDSVRVAASSVAIYDKNAERRISFAN